MYINFDYKTLLKNILLYFFTYKPSDFSVSDTEFWEIFHEKRGSSYSQGFGIQKQFLNSVVLLFFSDNTSSVGRSLTFRVSAYR